MFNFITRFFNHSNHSLHNKRQEFGEYFFAIPEHQWFDEQIKQHFLKLFSHLPLGVIKHLMSETPVEFLQSKNISLKKSYSNSIIIFPEFEELLRSSNKAAVAFLAQEIALLLMEAEEPQMDELRRELEADKFVSDLGLTFELESLLFMLDESIEKRMRLCYLTSHHFIGNS